MPTACGIHIDQRRFRAVALEGGPRKHRVVAFVRGEIPPGEDPGDHVAGELRRFAKEHKLSSEDVGLAVDSGLAAFRTLTLPFDDREKIEEVLKFEVESELPQWNIDDVVVDFLITDSKPGVESTLLVTALPKDRLAAQIAACESAGLEPADAELDGTALFNAAFHAGLLGAEAAQLLVHVGDTTTTVVVADGGRIRSLRAIRAGTRGTSLPPGVEPGAETGEPGAEAEETLVPAEDPVEADRRLEQSTQRIRRELARTISGARTTHPIEAIHLFGNELPALSEGDVLDVPIQRPEVFPDQAQIPGGSELVVAYGAALKQLGAARVDGHLRREELRYSGKFERLELPLAVFAILLTALLGVKLIVIHQQLLWRDEGDRGTWATERPLQGDLQIWLNSSNAYMFPDPERGYPGRLKKPPESILQYARSAERGDDLDRTKYEELLEIRRRLTLEIDRIQKDLGIQANSTSEIPQPQSALEATALVFRLLDELGDDVGRFAIRRYTANSQGGRTPQEQSVLIKLDMDFFAGSSVEATQNYTNFINELQAQPWLVDFPRKQVQSFPDEKGISIDGVTIEVDLSKVVRPTEVEEA